MKSSLAHESPERRFALPDAALRIYCDAPRMVPPRERGASRVGAGLGPRWSMALSRSESQITIIPLYRIPSWVFFLSRCPPFAAPYGDILRTGCPHLIPRDPPVAIDHREPELFSLNVLVIPRFTDYYLRVCEFRDQTGYIWWRNK